MRTLRFDTHLDADQALKLIELLEDLRDTVAEQYAGDISASLAPGSDSRAQGELLLDDTEAPF